MLTKTGMGAQGDCAATGEDIPRNKPNPTHIHAQRPNIGGSLSLSRMNCSGGVRRANQMRGFALTTGTNVVMLMKLPPMLTLIGCEHSRASTQRANPVQGGQDGVADKFRTILNALHRPHQRGIHFERDNVLFMAVGHDAASPCEQSGPRK